MSYKIKNSKPAGPQLKRVAAGQIQRARRALARKGGSRRAEAAHEARRHFKKIRGLLRLARRGLGREAFKREDIFFRDAGREIRAVRDATALVESLDGLGRRCFKGEPPAVVKELRALLVRNAESIARATVTGAAFARASRQLGQARMRVEEWELKDFTRKQARKAWRKGCDACREAFAEAHAEPTDENLHEWRKRAKDLWHETLLLRKACPELREQMEDLGTLTNILGEDHDLALLADAVRERMDRLKSPAQLKLLLTRLSARRTKLRDEAFALAARWRGWKNALKKS